MRKLERITKLIFVLIIIYAILFAVTAFGAPSPTSGEEMVTATASNLTSQISEATTEAEKSVNWLGVVCWIVIILGIVFIVYVLFSSNKRKGSRPKPVKYWRSPYRKRRRRMQNEYYRYKRNKYK